MGGIFNGSYGETYGTANLAANAWTHLAATYDGATLRLYVNGTQVASTAKTGTIAVSAGALTIGGDPLYGQYFTGRIDEVRIYSSALTQTQVQTDMATPIGGAAPPDTTPPTAPTGLGATAVSPTQVNLSWTAANDNVSVAQYRIERCQGAGCSVYTEIATSTTTSYNDSGRSPSTSYSYRVRAQDAALNLGPYSTTATTSTPAAPDTTPPTAPTGLGATAVSPTQVNLSWTAASDNVSVAQYRIERCQGAGCSVYTEIATSTTTSYNDSGRSPSTSYSYRVRAQDAALNLGPYSTTATTSTPAAPDTTPPTAPTGLGATAVSPTQVNLSWTAANDNVSVAQYRIERCQGAGCSVYTEIATSTTTSYNDSGRSPVNQLQLPRPRPRRRPQPRPLLHHRHHQHPRRPRHHPADRAHRAGRDRRQSHPGQPVLDRGQRQRQRRPVPDRALPGRRLQRLHRDRHQHHHQLQRQRPLAVNQLQLPRPRPRRRPQPRPLLHHRHHQHPRRPRHHPADRAHRAGRDRRQSHPGQPVLDRRHRQRQRRPVPDRALPGRRLQRLHRDRHQHHHQLQRQRPLTVNQLQLPRPRPRRRPQPRPLLHHRHHHHPRRPRHHPADRPHRAGRDRRQSHPGQPRPGPPPTTTSPSASTGSSAARAPAAASTPRSPPAPPPATTTAAARRQPATATASAPKTPPSTSAPTPPPPPPAPRRPAAASSPRTPSTRAPGPRSRTRLERATTARSRTRAGPRAASTAAPSASTGQTPRSPSPTHRPCGSPTG